MMTHTRIERVVTNTHRTYEVHLGKKVEKKRKLRPIDKNGNVYKGDIPKGYNPYKETLSDYTERVRKEKELSDYLNDEQ